MVWLIAMIIIFVCALVILIVIRKGVETRTYDANNPRDRKKLHEIVQGGPDERYICSGKF